MKTTLLETVRQTIGAHDLLRPGDHIVLGLSGGPDSVCLFHVLQHLASELDLTIHPVHVNHGFRPGDAERDQAYVEALCAKTGLSCRSFVVDVTSMAAELRMTSEEAGRKARYDAFYQVVREVQAGLEAQAPHEVQVPAAEPGTRISGSGQRGSAVSVRIAVAQNANDQAETILHRILRGTGTDGLSGIAYERYERGIPVIRPLLDVPRSSIEAYCRQHQLDPVIDHTNAEPIYTRNRIRLSLLPEMESFNENIIESLARLARIASADKAYLWAQAEDAYRSLLLPWEAVGGEPVGETELTVLDREGLAELPDAIRRRVIMKAFHEIGLASDISEERLRAADEIIGKKQAPKTVEFPHGYRLTVKKGRVYFSS